MKWVNVALGTVCALVAAGWTKGTTEPPGGNFQSVYSIGGGGYSKSIDIALDGTKVSSVDIWGAFVAQPGASSVWTPLINSTTFSSITSCADNNYPTCWQGDGPWDVRIAHSNSQIIFLNWNGELWRTTDQGHSFTKVSGTGLPDSTFSGDTGGNSPVTWCVSGATPRLHNPKTNVDPTQASLGSLTVVVPTTRYGTYITKNGGSTFSLISGIPTPFPTGGKSAATTSATTSGAVLTFSGGPPAGLTTNYIIVDETHPFAIPPDTFVSTTGATTVTMTNSVNSTVSSGDTIAFYFPNTDGCTQLELVAFDPTNGSTIYVSDPGTGILQSTDGGTTWAVISAGTPPAATDIGSSMVVCRDEYLWFADKTNGFVYTYGPIGSPTWTKTTQQFWTIACDPSTTSGVVAMQALSSGFNSLAISTDHGATIKGQGTGTRVATDVPWLAITPEGFNASELQYDPAQPGVVYAAEGIGVWHAPVVNAGQSSYNWTSQTVGIESLQGAGIVKSPFYVYPIMLFWDRAGFLTTNPNSYTAPAVQYPLSGTAGAGNAIIGGWSGDYASSSTSTECVLANSNFGVFTPVSGCTSNGLTWTQFPTEPDMLPLVTSAGSSVGSTTLTFASVPNVIGLDPKRNMNYVGSIVFPSSPVSNGSNTVAVSGLPAGVKVGDMVNTVGPGFLIAGAQGFSGTNLTQAIIEAISGGTLTLNIGASTSIPTTTMLRIQQSLQYTTNMASPAANELCFSSSFRGDINGYPITGPNVPHNTKLANITSGGACGAGETTVQLTNSMSVTDPGGVTYSLGVLNNPLPGQLVNSAGNTGTTLALRTALAYGTSGSANTDGVRAGETIAFQNNPGGNLAVSSPSNILYIQEADGNGPFWPLYTLDGGVTWNPALLCGSQCGTLAGFDSNGRATSNNCYGGGHGGFSRNFAADRVRPNTFYVFNQCGHGNGTGIGIYRSIDGGVTWTQQFTDSPSSVVVAGGTSIFSGAGAGLTAVPGQEDHVWFSNGKGFPNTRGNTTSGNFVRSCDGGATWHAVDATNLLNVAAFDFGAPTPGGNGYPSVIIYGNVNGTWGIWIGDNPATTCADGQTVTWRNISDRFLAGGLNLNGMIWLVADPVRYGYYYINAGGGSIWGHHSDLLKRDFGPASNDNSPAWLNEAA